MSVKYKGLDNRNLRLLNLSDADLVFEKHRKFIWWFQKSKTADIVAKKLGITPRQVANRAHYLRGKGIALKSMYQNRNALPQEKIESLAAVADSLAPQTIDYEKFVRVWQSRGPRGIRLEFDMDRDQWSWMVLYLRRRGVNLHNYRGRRDIPTLQRIADETASASSPKPPPHKPAPQPK